MLKIKGLILHSFLNLQIFLEMKKVSKASKLNQFSNQTIAPADLKKVKGGNDVVVVDIIMV